MRRRLSEWRGPEGCSFMPALRDGGDSEACLPRVPSAAADSTRGYSRFLPNGRMGDATSQKFGYLKNALRRFSAWRFRNTFV